MNMRRMGALFKREIKDILRDKKTLIMMILIPVLLYPLMIVGMSLIASATVASQEEKTYSIAFDKETVSEDIQSSISHIIRTQDDRIDYKLTVVESTDCEDDLQAESIDAYVSVEDDIIRMNYLSAKEKSSTAVSGLSDAFDIYEEQLTKEQLVEAGLDVEAILNPVTVERADQSSAEESIGSFFGSLIPFLIVTVVLLGAMYPAIDVTAGERERGTLETLLTLPVTNFEMIMSKFLAVSCIACCSALLNVVSMAGAIGFLMTTSLASADMGIHIRFETFIPGILFTVVVMMFFAMFVTAVCMCTCVFAKSFKDANNYITPVMLVLMFLSYAPMLPDLELDITTAAIPVVNVAFMIESLFTFTYDYGLFAIVLFSNVAYSLLAIMILGRIYNSESVLFAEGFSSVKLFEKRSEMKKNQMPGLGDVILVICVNLLLMFYIGTYAQIKWGFGGVAVQQVIILLCPLVYAWYMKADVRKLFSLKMIKPLQLTGALFMGVAVFLAAIVIGGLLVPVFPESAERLVLVDEMFASQPAVLLVLVVAVMPAIGEELLFRGFIMGTLKNKYKPVIAIWVTTLIFAAYHMSLIKMFTITIIGLGLTLAAYKSGSILASMLIHFLNNFFSVIVTLYPKQTEKVLPVLFKEKFSIMELLILFVIIAACAAVGWMLICKDGYKKNKMKE